MTPFPGQHLLYSHSSYHCPGSILSPRQFSPPPPWFLENIFADNIVLDLNLVVMNPFLKCFHNKLSAFDHLVKDIQVVFNLARKRRQTNFKNSRNVGKDDT
jgi:hypothetical protein